MITTQLCIILLKKIMILILKLKSSLVKKQLEGQKNGDEGSSIKVFLMK